MAPRITLRRRNAPTAVMVTAANYNMANQPHYVEPLAPRNNAIYEMSNVIQSPTGEASLVNFRRANTVKKNARNSINFGESFKIRKMLQRSNGSRKLARKSRSTRRRA
jgi:hypothetical protein